MHLHASMWFYKPSLFFISTTVEKMHKKACHLFAVSETCGCNNWLQVLTNNVTLLSF